MLQFVRGCLAKRQYATRVEADNAVRDVLVHRGERVETYRCHVCGKWHVGHHAKGKRKWKR